MQENQEEEEEKKRMINGIQSRCRPFAVKLRQDFSVA
jgi:hypothetical protein